MISQNNFKEQIREILLRIEKFPLIDCYNRFINELNEVRDVVNKDESI